MPHPNKHIRFALAWGILGAGLFAAAGPARAYNGFLKDFTELYPTSRTSQAGCLTCHGGNSSTLNAFGKDLCNALPDYVPNDAKPYLMMIESNNSDNDAGGYDNLAEINAHAQPGWTTGQVNQLYSTLRCEATGPAVLTPSGVPLPYDPPIDGAPVAVPGGPYSGFVNVPITFDGSGSFDSDGGNIVSWSWDFGDGNSADTAIVQHAYTTASGFTVSLTVTDDDGKTSTNTTTATISAASALDLDIFAFSIGKNASVGKPMTIKLSIENKGSVLGQAPATIVGMMGDTKVYEWKLNVFDEPGKGATTFNFPSYTPASKGTINWTATIADGNPDVDQAVATTTVK